MVRSKEAGSDNSIESLPSVDDSLDTLVTADHVGHIGGNGGGFDNNDNKPTDKEIPAEAVELARRLHKAGPAACCVARSLLDVSLEQLGAVKKFITDLRTEASLPKAMPITVKGISFPSGNNDFRAARDHTALACRRFNDIPDTAPPQERVVAWLDIFRPVRDRSLDQYCITHDQTFRDSALQNRQGDIPFVKPPFFVDYGLRLHIGPSTFINRDCKIIDTPVADVRIGQRCQIGPNCTIISTGHALEPSERFKPNNTFGKPVTIGDNVWLGANVTILPGVDIGDGSVIAAGSVVTKNIPGVVLAAGSPARVIRELNVPRPSEVGNTVGTLAEALRIGRGDAQQSSKEEEELEHLHRHLLSEEWKGSDSQASPAQEMEWPEMPAVRLEGYNLVRGQRCLSLWNLAVGCVYLYLASWLVKLYSVAGEIGRVRGFEPQDMNVSRDV